MEPLLIDKHALGELLSMGPDSARAFCERHGVRPVNVGLGRVSRLRWNRCEVMQLLSTLQAKGRPREHVRKSGRTSAGKTWRELARELSTPIQ